MTASTSRPPSYFDAIYAADPDPWRFNSSDYEREKYAATLATIPTGRVARGFEVGCSIGVLTRSLAEWCDELVSVDVAEAALIQARLRCAECRHVSIERMQIPVEWPSGRFDLILLSEVLYYLSPDDTIRTAERVKASLSPGGHVILVHYVGDTDFPQSGDEASERFISTGSFKPVSGRRTPGYRLDLLSIDGDEA